MVGVAKFRDIRLRVRWVTVGTGGIVRITGQILFVQSSGDDHTMFMCFILKGRFILLGRFIYIAQNW